MNTKFNPAIVNADIKFGPDGRLLRADEQEVASTERAIEVLKSSSSLELLGHDDELTIEAQALVECVQVMARTAYTTGYSEGMLAASEGDEGGGIEPLDGQFGLFE